MCSAETAKRRPRSTESCVSTCAGQRPEPLSSRTTGLRARRQRRKRVPVMQTAQHRPGAHEHTPPPIDAGIQSPGLEQLPVENRAHQHPTSCEDGPRCNESSTSAAATADEPRISGSSSPVTRGGSSRTRARRPRSPSDSSDDGPATWPNAPTSCSAAHGLTTLASCSPSRFQLHGATATVVCSIARRPRGTA